MKIKDAALLLMIGSAFWFISQLYYFVKIFNKETWQYYKERQTDVIMNGLMLLVPVTVFLFALAVQNRRGNL